MDNDTRDELSTNGHAGERDRPEPIEWAALTRETSNADHAASHETDLPTWIPPPPGSLASRLSAWHAGDRGAPRLSSIAGRINGAKTDEDETQLDALRDIEHHEDLEHDEDGADEPAFADLTIREALATRGARFLAIVAVCTILGLLASSVVLWQRIEDVKVERQPAPAPSAVERQLTEIRRRLARVETRIAANLDPTGTTVTTTPPEFLYQLALLRNCVVEFQQALDSGKRKYTYC